MSAREIHIAWGARGGRAGIALSLAALIALAAAPFYAGSANLSLLSQFLAYLALASLWNLLAGFSGLVSVGQQAYVGLGGYCLFGLTMFAGVPPLAAIPLAGLTAAVLSIPVAALLFRLRGAYFAIGSWVVAEVFRLTASQIPALGGGSGTSLPTRVIAGMASSRQAREFTIYWSSLALAVLVLGLTIWLLRSRWGLALRAIHFNEAAAGASGVDTARVKLLVYAVAACGTSMAGALIFLQKLRISPDAAFSVNDWTAFVIFMTVIGGIGRVEGPVVGAVIFFVLRQALADLGSLYLLMLGAVAIAAMLKAPKGVWGYIVEKTGFELAPLGRRIVYTQSEASSPAAKGDQP